MALLIRVIFGNSGRRWCASRLQQRTCFRQVAKWFAKFVALVIFGLWVWRRKFVERNATGQVLGHELLLLGLPALLYLVAGLKPYKFDDKALMPHRSARVKNGRLAKTVAVAAFCSTVRRVRP
jgi:hypothetical protein